LYEYTKKSTSATGSYGAPQKALPGGRAKKDAGAPLFDTECGGNAQRPLGIFNGFPTTHVHMAEIAVLIEPCGGFPPMGLIFAGYILYLRRSGRVIPKQRLVLLRLIGVVAPLPIRTGHLPYIVHKSKNFVFFTAFSKFPLLQNSRKQDTFELVPKPGWF
jgi:hypothetical protein